MQVDELLSLVCNSYNFLYQSECESFREHASDEDTHKLDALAQRWDEADTVERELIADEAADIVLGVEI